VVFFIPKFIIPTVILVVGITFVIRGITSIRRKDEGGLPLGVGELVFGLLALGAAVILWPF
jgi:hypothetical protein